MFKFLKRLFKGENGVRVRIAPSPTGYLHIGTARTALFNYIFAKKYGGKFILRIEDTDLERSDKKYEKDIIENLKWLGLDWDEGPYRQSERLNIYEKYLNKLLKEKKAYWCPHTKEELEEERNGQIANKTVLIHKCDARDKDLSRGELIRFKIPKAKPVISGNETIYPADSIIFNDIIRSQVHFFTDPIGDFALAKNISTPLYNFAVVIDDYEMKISHVIRGEDHIANTPKQILIQRALNFSTPQYAHLPLILDPDRSKMSKRHSATSIEEYQKQGYLPETLVNFMALLGWHPSDNKEKMSLPEIIQCFDIKRIQKGGAIFDVQKLDWLNSQYIKKYDNEALLKLIKQLPDFEIAANDSQLLKIINYGKERAATLKNFQAIADSYTRLNDYKSEMLLWKNTGAKNTKENLRKTKEILFVILEREFNKSGSEKYLMPLADSQGRGEVLWPLRVALTGRDKSPGPFEIIDVLGKEESLKRINMAIEKLSNLII
ncbi:MAG: glutamate--tRNA ligase [Candidatus Harrisonbacteria bacterium RIFCSPLOWO2_02_FULL_41_11]|uniref:Glutamate--tRNA ligase n=1 Tax=Candidatus Harrisonbacteria bacterium RIFCSPHIGHO2_02_FULL_42_16 TaxID=1798404 RepID=A0A1G1ZIL3_9BACT|nr:MAG: glutamate--tRNA ligase [Candidatus Harrisonbacteria bacterium RIFCSPHIGHO2_02_FULL_42_16]OGY66244.1 MAG: glutamate--tRNA ligase [Candidatus Harrisonbacteria bacterium RIFCSPLOWO2_02_FULL_41_11]